MTPLGVRKAWHRVGDFVYAVDEWFQDTRAGQYFLLSKRRSRLSVEILGGLVTYMCMAYILAVNAAILTDSGGPCTVNDCTGPQRGTDACKTFTDAGYSACLDETRSNLITATAASSLVACFIMGAFANMPVGLAPGLGLNAYLSYNLVGYHGSGSTSYGAAMAAIFIEGWIFLLLTVTGARAKLITYVPRSIALAMSAGIGLFLAFIGLQYEEGLGVVSADISTLVTLGACPVEDWVPLYAIPDVDAACASKGPDGTYALLTAGSNHVCGGHKMSSPRFWLGAAGLTLMCVLMHRGYRGSIIVGILFVTFVSWIPNHGASYLGASADAYPGGVGNTGTNRLAYFKKVVAAPSLSRTGWAYDWGGLKDGNTWLALITFLFTDFLDATGTLFAMANFINTSIPGFVDRNKRFPKSTWAFSSDAIGIIVGSTMGTSPVTAYIESSTGIKEGARTGIAALTVAFCFFLSLFFNPLLASIPPYATGPALILVGSLMLINVVKIKWGNVNEAVPAFLTIIIMPMTYSIAYGVIGGLVAYIVSNGINWFLDYCEDAWDRWRHVGDGSSSGDADDDKAPHGTFGRGSSGPGTQRLSIGDRRSLERSSVAGGAKLYTAKTFNLHRGDTAQEDDATDIQDSAHVDTLQQGPHGMAEEAAPPEGPKKSGRSVSFAEAVAFDTPASDGEHLHPSREGSADQLADGDSGLEGRLPEGIMDTPDSAGSGEAPPAQASPRQRMQRAGIMHTPDSAGSGEAPPAQASPKQRMQRAVRAGQHAQRPAARPGRAHAGGPDKVSMPGNQQHDQGRLAQEGLRSQNASPAPGALRRQNSTGLASPQGSHRSPLDDMFAPGEYRGSPASSRENSLRGGTAAAAALAATRSQKLPPTSPSAPKRPKSPAPSPSSSLEAATPRPMQEPTHLRAFSLGEPNKSREHQPNGPHSHPPRAPIRRARPSGLDRTSAPAQEPIQEVVADERAATLWRMPHGDGEMPMSPFSEEGRKALQTSLSSRQLAELLRSHTNSDELGKPRRSVKESFADTWGGGSD